MNARLARRHDIGGDVAKKKKNKDGRGGTLGDIAERLGTLLGNAEKQWKDWQGPRDQVVQAVTDVRDRASALLAEMGVPDAVQRAKAAAKAAAGAAAGAAGVDTGDSGKKGKKKNKAKKAKAEKAEKKAGTDKPAKDKKAKKKGKKSQAAAPAADVDA